MASHRLTHEDSKSTHQPPRIRRSRSTLTYSTSSSLSSMSSLSSYSSSSPSPFQTPFHPSSSAIPFSWERTPGIPKTPLNNTLNSRHVPHLLPLPPPPFRSNSSKLADVDPFAAAVAECAKDPPPGESEQWENRPETVAIGGVGRWRSIGEWIGFGFGFGFLDMYGSCKSSCSVSEPTMEIPRASQGVVAYRVLNRRVG